jgi:glycosyltransferase involved in cell wall biosynthesis
LFSEYEKKIFADVYPSTAKRLRVIPNGVDVTRFDVRDDWRTRARERLALVDSDFSMIFIGHEFDRKGLSFVIEALLGLPDHVRLIVVGGAEYMQRKYGQLARDLGVDARVAFLGVRGDVEQLLNAADAFVLPTFYEAWPLVGLEAMACGTPALMTPVGGITECLANGENGFFIKRDPKDIAEKVKTLMDDPELLRNMRSNARETALKYSWDKVAEQYLDLIKEVAEEKAGRA